MNKKIRGIFVCMLLIASIVTAMGIVNVGQAKATNTSILGENKNRGEILPLLFHWTWLDQDWNWAGKLLYPYNNGMIVLFGNSPWGPWTATEPRIQANAAGGARILAQQGNTPDKPAIGFFSTNGVDDGGGGTGMYRPLANTIAFSTGSTERMRISSGGNIGIRESNPSSRLHDNGSFAVAVAQVAAGSNSSNPYMLTVNDCIILVNNNGYVQLPLASTCPGREYTIKKISVSGNVNIWTSGSDLIDGQPTRILGSQWNYMVVVSSGGSDWYIVG